MIHRHAKRFWSGLLLLLLLLVALPQNSWAQTGRLIGTVTDSESGDSIPGATVLLEETSQGTATDLDGRYVVLNVRPGTYTVRVSFIGYTPSVIENVRVTSDRATTLNVQLSTQVVQGGEIVVEALAPVVDQTQTTSRALVTGAEIEKLPVSSLEGVIGRTSNAYDGFVRGSRRFETRTVVEGIDVSDTFYSLSAGSSYEGTRYGNVNRSSYTSASILTLNPGSVEEVTVNSGATDPQYNGGSGGVVAIALRNGRGPITGNLSVRVAPFISRPGPDSLAFYFDGQEYLDERDGLGANPLKQSLYTWTPDKYDAGGKPELDIQGTVSGSITDNWGFSLSGQWFRSNGYQPNQFVQRMNLQAKTNFQVAKNTEISVIGLIDDRGLWGGWNNTSYVELWRYYLEAVAQDDAGTYAGSVRLRQIINDNSYFTLQAYRTYNRNRIGYVDDDGDGFQELGEDGDFLDFFDQSVVDKYIGTSSRRDEENAPTMFIDVVTDNPTETGLNLPDGRRYRLARPSPFSEDVTSVTNSIKLDYANQITFNHFLQIGAEFKQRSFDYALVDGLPGPGAIINDEEEPFRSSRWERNPNEISLYAADRIQYAGLIINIGARLNLVDRDTEQIANYYYPFRRDTVSVGGRDLARNTLVRGDDVKMDVLFNPSIGVSHPIGSNASMYFSYNRSQQLLPYSTLYRYYDGIQTTSRFFNMMDPEIEPITSDNYELGVQWEFAPGWGVDLNAYGRSIDNFAGVTFTAFENVPEGEARTPGFDRFGYTTNTGYAESRGIELVLRRRPLEIANDVELGVTASYTYSTVEASSTTGDNETSFSFQDPEAGEDPNYQLPFGDAREFDNFAAVVSGGSTITGGFGRRHRGILRAVAELPYAISAGLIGTFESGFQYPKAVGADERDRERITAPTNHRIDLRVEKGVDFTDRIGLDVYLDITNLTNHANVIAYENYTPDGPATFQRTGVPGSRLIRNDGSPLYGRARAIYFGTRLRF